MARRFLGLLPAAGPLLITAPALAQVTERVNLSSNQTQSNWYADLPQAGCFVSADGRYVAFRSGASDLVPNDTNGSWDIFVRDRLTQTTERVSVDSSGAQANASSGLIGLSMTPDGRFVAFYSDASNLVSGGTSGVGAIFLRDRSSGTTELISLSSAGIEGNAASGYPSVSDDGRWISFDSLSSNLVAGDTNGLSDVFVRDRQSGITERISLASSGAEGNGHSFTAAISADGRYVVFVSYASNLVTGDTNGQYDVFVRDRLGGTTERVSVSSSGLQGNSASDGWPSISSDGRYVAFVSNASNLVPNDTNGAWDLFVHDLQTGSTVRANVATGGAQSGAGVSPLTSISADGRFVAFESAAQDLVFPTGTGPNVFVRDWLADSTTLASISSTGGLSNGSSEMPSISSSGRFVVFRSDASNLVLNDTNSVTDILLHDRLAAGFESLCVPGIEGVVACPCGNPPSGRNRGCDNSSATGGASLSANGFAYLSIDSLAFTTNDEKANATSILLQSDSWISSGLVFGQGVRCAAGTLKRLYVKVATAGSITAPDFGAGDATVSARSAQLGVSIQPGQPYYYFVYYRDPIVLGGCPVAGTFNATQAGRISWWP